MPRLKHSLLGASIVAMMPVIAGAAGTYYNGNLYQSPQSRYMSNGGFYNTYGAGRGYGQYNQQMVNHNSTNTNTAKSAKQQGSTKTKQGFYLNANVSHEFADWNFEMASAGSKLNYDGLRWNVISGEGVYYFGDTTPMQIKVGARYGRQYGDTSMTDDDISNEAMWDAQAFSVNGEIENVLIGTPALSIGTSNGGTQMGFNVSFGLTDFFKTGSMKITPSIGYRYFKHELKTKNNYGMVVNVVNSDTFVNCLEVSDGEIQCSPYVGFADVGGQVGSFAGFALADGVSGAYATVTDAYGNTVNLLVNPDGSFIIPNNTGMPQIDVGETYYYEQSGVSHKYETEWAGPYVALDAEYTINDNNFVNAGVEFGLPIYESKGNQPYRIDWAHPTSIKDKGNFGDAYHLGLNATWSTAITDSMMLSLGLTYDYYKVSDASATTYLNSSWYEDAYADLVNDYTTIKNAYDDAVINGGLTAELAADMESVSEDYKYWTSVRSAGWSMKTTNEIESIYKSMGVRLGLNVKF